MLLVQIDYEAESSICALNRSLKHIEIEIELETANLKVITIICTIVQMEFYLTSRVIWRPSIEIFRF